MSNIPSTNTNLSIDELKSKVSKYLLTTGKLDSLRHEIRTYVSQSLNSDISKETSTDYKNDILIISLIVDYLTFYNLDYTLSELFNETRLAPSIALSRLSLIDKLKLNTSDDSEPLLISLLNSYSNNIKPESNTDKIINNLFQYNNNKGIDTSTLTNSNTDDTNFDYDSD